MRIKSSSYLSLQYLCRVLCLMLLLFAPNAVLATDSCIHTTTAGKTLDTDLGCLYTALNQTYDETAGKQWTAYPYGGSGPIFQITCSSSGVCTNDGAPVSCPIGEGVNIYKPASGSCTAMKIYHELPLTPGITSITPISGLTGQTVSVTVGGANFGNGATVKIEQGTNVIKATNVVVVDPQTVTCQLPLALDSPVGAWDVVVTNTTGRSGKGVKMFAVSNGHTPIVTSLTKTMIANATMAFTAIDFTTHFSNEGGGSLAKIKILTLPNGGTLKLSGSAVVANQEIVFGDLGSLTYEPKACLTGGDVFSWNGADDLTYAVSAANVNITITPDPNAPKASDIPKLGTENGIVVFEAKDFTAHFIGGNLTKIIVPKLPLHGTLKLLDTPVTDNQEIIEENLDHLTFVSDHDWYGQASFDWCGYSEGVCPSSDGVVDITVTAAAETSYCERNHVVCYYLGPVVTGIGAIVAGITLYHRYCKGAHHGPAYGPVQLEEQKI